MSNYLKKILFSLLILVTPYMNSASNAMNEADYDGSTMRTRKVSLVEENRPDVLSFSNSSTTSKVINLEDSKVSWTSYLSSPVKSVFQGTYEIAEFTIQRPKLAMIIGLAYLMPSVAAACTCYCRNDLVSPPKCTAYGEVYDFEKCKVSCWTFKWLTCGSSNPGACHLAPQ